MGCGYASKKVMPESFARMIQRPGEIAQGCTVCGSFSNLTQKLECHCFLCRSCVVKELEGMLTANKPKPLRFNCEKCKRKQQRIRTSAPRDRG